MKKYILSILSILILISYSCKKDDKIEDSISPTITLKGDSIVRLELGTAFIDSGYTATDNKDGDITSKVIVSGSVDESKQGVYQIKYNVTDSDGNKAKEKIRTVIVHRTLLPQMYQKGFAISYTATWCVPCGNWGAPLIHKYASDAPEGAVISIHVTGDPMLTNLYTSFTNDRTTNSAIPSFWVGDIKTGDQNAMVDLFSINISPIGGIDYNYTTQGDSIYVEVKTSFFNSDNGDYYLSVLVLEDGIDGSSNAPTDYIQQGTSTSYPNDDYKHDFVLRASSIPGEAYGELIVQNPSIDTSVTKNYVIAVDPQWNNPYPVCILWKHIAGTKPEYHFINSLKRKN